MEKKMNGRILPIEQLSPLTKTSNAPSIKQAETETVNFGDLLKNALEEVNKTQKESDKQTNLLFQGKVENLHDVMIAAQKASLTLEATVQIQQKVIDTYNEIMRMQI